MSEICHRVAGVSVLAAVLAASSIAGVEDASALTVIGGGNGTFFNSCRNQSSSHAGGRTTGGAGVVSGLSVMTPASGPINECGGLGLTAPTAARNKRKYTCASIAECLMGSPPRP